MAISSHFIHKCDINRPFSGSVDAHGLGDEDYTVVNESIPFRLVEDRERVERTEDAERMILTTYTGLFHASVDLQEKDKLTNVKEADGTVIDHEFVIEELLKRHGRSSHHLSAVLQRVS